MAFKDDPAESASGTETRTDVGSGLGRGIFDCEGAHQSPRKNDYERVFQSGMVVLDTNVLLNLYRSNARTR